jgi:CDP-diacylglycerol--glycerol-3-phosphate 3-phosphatidyltransferase
VLRIAAAPLLVVLAVNGAERPFTWVLIPALLSDIVDGYLARRLGLTSVLGAMLDSIGDLLLFLVSVVGIWCFHPDLLLQHRVAGLLLVTLWVGEPLVAIARYGRVSSFHTYASKVAAYLLGIMIGVLFVWGPSTPLLYTAVAAGVVASVEELVLIGLLPSWRANVRGLYWVLREVRSDAP